MVTARDITNPDAIDQGITRVWQHYGQACVRCGRVFSPDEVPELAAPAIPGQRPAQRRCRTRCPSASPGWVGGLS